MAHHTCIQIKSEITHDNLPVLLLKLYKAKTVRLDTKVSSCISKAGNIFRKLWSHVWENKYLTIYTKVNSTRCVLSSLLYRSETWACHAIHQMQAELASP